MQDIIRILTWTFIHSLWQGLLVALLAAIIISTTRKSTARLRYNLLCIIVILFLVTSAITFVIQWKTIPGPSSISTIANDAVTVKSSTIVLDNIIDGVNANSNTLIFIWAFFFLFSCLRMVTGLVAVNRLRHYRSHPVPGEWKARLQQLQLVAGVQHSVSLLQSELVKVPMALGILKPVIFLPVGLLTHLPVEQVETILLHELAHIRRKDYLVNLLQHIAEAIFFFNPAIRWLSSLIRQEREACCDDMVVAGCGQKNNYLSALISFQEYSLGHSSYAMAITYKRQYLLNRVKRMITNKNEGINLFEKIGLLSAVLLFSAFSFVTKENKVVDPAPSFVQEQPAILPLDVVVNSQPPTKNEKNKVNRLKIPLTDTIPAKRNTRTRDKDTTNKQLPVQNDWEKASANADAALKDIIKMKDQIGEKKERIGEKKEELKTKNGAEKDKIMKEIEMERNEIEKQRKELNLKRAEWDLWKKKAARTSPVKKDGASIETETDRSATIEKDRDEKKPGIKNEKAWQLKNKNISPDNKIAGFKKIDPVKWQKQEFNYKMKLQMKAPQQPKSADKVGTIKKPDNPHVKKVPSQKPGL
jgi:bla regulator protein blaR1